MSKKIFILVGCVVAVLVIVFGIVPHMVNGPLSYQGKETFSTMEYCEGWKSEFDEEVRASRLSVKEYKIRATQPDVVVSFTTQIPTGYKWPEGLMNGYGAVEGKTENKLLGVVVSLMTSIFLIGFPIYKWKRT